MNVTDAPEIIAPQRPNNAGHAVMPRRRPTIGDVAREAGVSVGTVSHVINGTAKVRLQTRNAVLQAIRHLSYRPNTLARSMNALSRAGHEVAGLARPRLLAVGHINVDYTAFVDVLPHRGDRSTAQRIRKTLGGPAANVAAAAAALGGNVALEVDLASALGDDADSEWALLELAQRNVHVLPVRRPPRDRLSRCLILVERNGHRTIINEPFELTAEDLGFPLEPECAPRPQCLHVEGFQAISMRAAMQRYREAGWRTSLHSAGLPANQRNIAALTDLAGETDVMFLNQELAREVLGLRDGVDQLVDAFGVALEDAPGRGHVILTLGEHGAALFERGAAETVRLSAPQVPVVDATGAGDAFAGVFLGFWLHGFQPEAAARRAVVAGSVAVTAEGAQGNLINVADIEARLDAPAQPVQVPGAAGREVSV